MLEKQIAQYLATIEKLFAEHADAAVELLLTTVWWEVANRILAFAGLLAAGVVCAVFAYRCARMSFRISRHSYIEDDAERTRLKNLYARDCEVGYDVTALVAGVAAFSFLLGALINFPDLITLASLDDPRIWLVHKALN